MNKQHSSSPMPFPNDFDKSLDLMSPKVDFVFKLLFGEENHKDLLIAFLQSVLRLSPEELQDVELLNTELTKSYVQEKKGILDVKAKTQRGEIIDIEIQIFPSQYMSERTLFYWAKMYTSQIETGQTYDRLKKCITINILDFTMIDQNKLHNIFHLWEDESPYKLSDVLEIHFLELPKLKQLQEMKDADDPALEWLLFLSEESKEGMQMLAEKNKQIERAYEILQQVSQSKEHRQVYEARQAELMDQRTREKTAREEGIKQALQATAIRLFKLGMETDMVEQATGLSKEEIIEIQIQLDKKRH